MLSGGGLGSDNILEISDSSTNRFGQAREHQLTLGLTRPQGCLRTPSWACVSEVVTGSPPAQLSLETRVILRARESLPPLESQPLTCKPPALWLEACSTPSHPISP